MENDGKICGRTKIQAVDVRLLEGMISDALNKLRENFPDGDCKASFKLPEADGVVAMSLTGESGKYTLHLSLLTPDTSGACALQTCCPVRGNRREIRCFLRAEQAKKQLMDKIRELLDG